MIPPTQRNTASHPCPRRASPYIHPCVYSSTHLSIPSLTDPFVQSNPLCLHPPSSAVIYPPVLCATLPICPLAHRLSSIHTASKPEKPIMLHSTPYIHTTSLGRAETGGARSQPSRKPSYPEPQGGVRRILSRLRAKPSSLQHSLSLVLPRAQPLPLHHRCPLDQPRVNNRQYQQQPKFFIEGR